MSLAGEDKRIPVSWSTINAVQNLAVAGADMTRFRMTPKGREANPRASQNVETWNAVKNAFLLKETLSTNELYTLCAHHDHPAGGSGFIAYVQGYQWIEATN